MKRSAWLGILVLTALIATAGSMPAQTLSTSSSPAPGDDRGLSFYSSFGTAHDSSTGWTNELNWSLRYDFNKAFSMELGVPVYMVRSPSQTSLTGGTATSTSYNSLGDVYLHLNYSRETFILNWAATLTGTAPSGDTSTGISSGHATVDWNNRLEHQTWRLTPFVEAGIGNSANAVNQRRFKRPFMAIGGVTHYKAGTAIDLWKGLSFEASAYDVLPFTDQKIYSRLVPRNRISARGNARRSRRVYELLPVVAGGSSLAADNGFTGALTSTLNPRLDVELAYNRSIPHALDTVTFTVGVRLGHVGKQPPVE